MALGGRAEASQGTQRRPGSGRSLRGGVIPSFGQREGEGQDGIVFAGRRAAWRGVLSSQVVPWGDRVGRPASRRALERAAGRNPDGRIQRDLGFLGSNTMARSGTSSRRAVTYPVRVITLRQYHADGPKLSVRCLTLGNAGCGVYNGSRRLRIPAQPPRSPPRYARLVRIRQIAESVDRPQRIVRFSFHPHYSC